MQVDHGKQGRSTRHLELPRKEYPVMSQAAAAAPSEPHLPLPILGYNVLLVGEMTLTEPLAQAMMTIDAPSIMVLPAAVAYMEQRLRPKESTSRQGKVHLVERLDETNYQSKHLSLNGVVMDHVVWLMPYCESNPSWRRDIVNQLLPGLAAAITKEDILYGKVTIVAIPNRDRSMGMTSHETTDKDDNDSPMSSLLDLRQQIPIFVCYIQDHDSRATVATMLWNRITRLSGPCSPLVTMQF